MTDLITELHTLAQRMAAAGETDEPVTVSLAAEEIERLRAEVERLYEDNQLLRRQHGSQTQQVIDREQERDQLKAALQRFMDLNVHDRDLSDELWCIQQEEVPNDISLAQHDAEVIDRLKTEMMTYVAKLNMQPGVEFAVDFMDDKIDQLRQQAKEASDV
jgi:uncharacterized protein YqgQ